MKKVMKGLAKMMFAAFLLSFVGCANNSIQFTDTVPASLKNETETADIRIGDIVVYGKTIKLGEMGEMISRSADISEDNFQKNDLFLNKT